MENQIKQVIEELRPYLQSDGGDMEFVGFDTVHGIVQVRFQGACQGCPISHMTLYQGVEKTLKEKVQGVKGVEAVE